MKIDDLYYAKEGAFYGSEVRAFAVPPIGDDRDLWLQGPDADFLISDDGKVYVTEDTLFHTIPRLITGG